MDVEAEIVLLSRRIDALEAGARDQRRFNTRFFEMLTELRDDVATLRRHAVATGRKVEELETRMERLETRMERLETRMERVEAQITDLRRDLPGIVADAMRDVLKEAKGGA